MSAPVTVATIEERLLEHLRRRTAGRIPADAIAASTPLAESGILDSLGFIDFVGHLQSSFAIALEPDDYRPERIGTVAACAELVAGKLGVPA